ncbi:hypothetical protein [Streptomyces lavendofoliae]|uniref:Lipoprotein n=1 Tax=Streptomyces lavendofoliae TaxID=67314 RepID=A0A918M5M6_9ACTN|nr:hypothetical protein [Streptomyces lavendofoliae]GGU44055.1 hypothetical protein GCM10010274_35030 [Streptomyces lavendofoliae]
MKRVMQAGRMIFALILTGLCVVACEAETDQSSASGVTGMNMQEAAERADGMLDATIAAVVPEIEWAHEDTTSGSCEVTRRRTVMTVISDQRRGNFLGVVERFWKKQGYKITAVRRDPEMPAVYAQTPEAFAIRVLFGYQGQAFFEATTPCVVKSGVGEPKSVPNGPAYDGVAIPTPNVRSGFWSSEEPLTRS